jgi:hypothetical protein
MPGGGLKAYQMAAKKKASDGAGSVVRIDADLITKGRYLAAREGVALSEYLSRILRPAIEREFKKAGRELMDEGQK